MGDDLWNAINSALVSLQAMRDQYVDGSAKAKQLDTMINSLRHDQQVVGSDEAKDALAKLADENAIGHLQALTANLKSATIQLSDISADVSTAATVVSIAGSIVTTVLPLLA